MGFITPLVPFAERRIINMKVKYIDLDKKKFIVGVALAFSALIICWIAKASVLFSMIICVLYTIVGLFKIKINKKVLPMVYIVWYIVGAVIGLYLSQMYFDVFWGLAKRRIVLGILCCIVLFLIMYLITVNIRISLLIGMALIMTLSMINYYVYQFQGNAFSPFHFLSLSTALIVADNYKIVITPIVAETCVMAGLYVFCGFLFEKLKTKRIALNRLGALIGTIIIVGVIHLGIQKIDIQHWGNLGGVENGYLLNFAMQLEDLFVLKPDGYDENKISEIISEYDINASNNDSNMPNVIVIMGEAFSDLTVLGNQLQTNESIMPFTESLEENTIKGYALSSVFGGNTANSEFEFLTGNSMAWLPKGAVPYQQYIKDETYSITSIYKDLGYTCIAMHPCDASGWSRSTVYPLFGFDEMYFDVDFPNNHKIRNYISDMEMVNFLINRYEEEQSDNPLFIFGVTVQNHGGYNYTGDNYNKTVTLNGYTKEYADVEQYLTLMQQSDQALEKMISYFQKVEEDVVVVVFGDHLPRLDSIFYEEVHGGVFTSLDEIMLQYKVPFFIWANYEIEEQYVECTSLNYLANYMFEAAGIPLPAYNQFLEVLKEKIPAMNANGYYSEELKRFISYEEMHGEEKNILNCYEILQYNSIFDKENKSDVFFNINNN